MIITCNACNARFNLDENLLKPTGSKVRCSKCNEVFTAYPPKPSEETEAPIEITPEIEDQPDVTAVETEEKETASEDTLDFSDMEKLLDEQEAATAEGAAEEETKDLELDLDLDISPEAEPEKKELEAGVEQPEGDDLDMSDLETLLDTEESAQEKVEDEVDEELKLEADFDSDAVAKVPPKKAEFEELDELDLSDLEEILDLEEPTAEDESVSEDIELELDLEAEPELEESPAGDEEDLETVDLSEIEKMLEVEETEEEEAPEEKDLDLELEMEEAPAEPSLTEEAAAVEVYELDEAEEAPEEPEPAEAVEDEGAKPEFEFEEGVEEEVTEKETADVTPAAAAVAAPAKERRVSKTLVFLLILVLLAGGSYGAYVLLNYFHIQIPYVSDYFKPKVPDPKGSLKIETLDINSKFILNVKAGKLFVITGKVKNGYSDSRNFISVSGKLFTKGKKVAKTETVFCGNVISDIELSNLEYDAIKKRLLNRFGDNRSNFQVAPGKELPFMMVFSDLPENLEEFTVEAAGSISTATK